MTSSFVNDLVLWKEPTQSLLAVGVGTFYYIAIGFYGWSTLSFVCLMLAMTLLVRLIFFKGRQFLADAKLIAPVSPPVAPEAWLSEAEVQSHLTTITAHMNRAISACFSLSFGDDLKLTFTWIFALVSVSWLCQLLSPTGLSFLLFAAAFTAPKFYQLKQPEVDAAVELASARAAALCSQAELAARAAIAKLPKIPSAHDLKEAQEEEKKKL